MAHELSGQDRRALAAVVPDPDEWVAHCIEFFKDEPGKAQQAIADKIAKCRAELQAAEERHEPYKTRVQRDDEDHAAIMAELEASNGLQQRFEKLVKALVKAGVVKAEDLE